MFRRVHVGLGSRRLFRNWLSAGIKYYLVKHGLAKGNIIVKCGDNEFRLSLEMYSFIVNAYYDGFLRDPLCSDNGFMGKLWGVIDLVIRGGNVF